MMTILLIASAAVVMIGGLALVPKATMQSASASHGGVHFKVTICHIPPGNPANRHTITEGAPAVAGHVRNHGDYIGACQPP